MKPFDWQHCDALLPKSGLVVWLRVTVRRAGERKIISFPLTSIWAQATATIFGFTQRLWRLALRQNQVFQCLWLNAKQSRQLSDNHVSTSSLLLPQCSPLSPPSSSTQAYELPGTSHRPSGGCSCFCELPIIIDAPQVWQWIQVLWCCWQCA